MNVEDLNQRAPRRAVSIPPPDYAMDAFIRSSPGKSCSAILKSEAFLANFGVWWSPWTRSSWCKGRKSPNRRKGECDRPRRTLFENFDGEACVVAIDACLPVSDAGEFSENPFHCQSAFEFTRHARVEYPVGNRYGSEIRVPTRSGSQRPKAIYGAGVRAAS